MPDQLNFHKKSNNNSKKMQHHLIIPMLLLAILNLIEPTTQTLLPQRSLTENNISFPSTTTLSHCRTKCGKFDLANISTWSGSIYPFGIGQGCFRPGFELTCNDTTSDVFLFDGTTKVASSDDFPYAVLVHSDINILHHGVDSYNGSWKPPSQPSRADFYAYDANFTTIGCGVRTSLFDPRNNAKIGSCATSCENEEKLVLQDGMCKGGGCCTIFLGYRTTEFQFRISRDEKKNKSGMHNVKAFLHSRYDDFNISQADLLSNDTVGAGDNIPTVWLDWSITDKLNCMEAGQYPENYACVSKHSQCYEEDEESNGYNCYCADLYQGNPYIVDGCQEENPYNKTRPESNCSRKCGGMDVPFPFGLDDGCYGKESFRLNCTDSKLFLNDYIPIAEILVDEGLLRVDIGSDYFWEYMEFRKTAHEWINVTWFIENVTCSVANLNISSYACVSDHSKCLEMNDSSWGINAYRCQCFRGFQGNPYILDGCRDINECLSPVPVCNVTETCNNTIGSYECIKTPKRGQIGLIIDIIIGISSGIAALLFLMCTKLSIRRLKREKQKKTRKINFNTNQGLLLQQLIPSEEAVADRRKIFSLEELEIATNNFDRARILGQGGHGTIYKGILLDQGVVAIKKAKLVKQTEINQFINEVAILSQINHRNVVRLFGCCLETEVPLLVYEFISNGTLYDKLHKCPNNICSLTWRDRLRIAIEAAGALCYLHSAASISIFHRDVKSSNILLDDNYTAKVSDFGASRSVPINQKEVFTAVQGTFGYLDPEYYHTGQLSEKSDVYSFGVIIVELLTRKKPIFTNNQGEPTNLSNYFLQALRDGSYTELIDVDIREELTELEMKATIDLVEMCLKLRGEERPTMKEVEMKLQFMRSNREKQEQLAEIMEEVPLLAELVSTPNHMLNPVSLNSANNSSIKRQFMESMSYPR